MGKILNLPSLDPNKRASATQLLNHEYFEENHFREIFHLSMHSKKRIRQSPLVSVTEASRYTTLENLSNISTPGTTRGRCFKTRYIYK